MTNLMFLSQESTIIKLLNKEDGGLCYFRLVSCFLLLYFCVPCESMASSLSKQADLRVDLTKLKQLISSVLC